MITVDNNGLSIWEMLMDENSGQYSFCLSDLGGGGEGLRFYYWSKDDTNK